MVHFNICLGLQPNHAAILNLRGIAHGGVGNYQAYLFDSQRASALNPTDPESCNNTGAARLSLGQAKEAIAWFDKALALTPNSVTVLTNKALAMSECRRLEEAEAVYAQVQTIAPGHAMAELSLALLKLLTGDFTAGWVGREARWKIPSLSAHYPRFQRPMWRGEPHVEGKTILIHVDEGLGDTIQYARYVPMVAARGARVVLVVPDSLQSLMAGLDGVDTTLTSGA